MWIWPSFARADKLKRNAISIVVIVLAVALIFVVAPLVAGSFANVVIAVAAFLAIGIALRFVPAELRIRKVRRAEDALKASHPEVPTIVANVRVRSGSAPELGTSDYRTLVIGLGAETLTLWSPDAPTGPTAEPLLEIARTRLLRAEYGPGSPAHLRLTVAPVEGNGEELVLAVAVFRANGTQAAGREQLQEFAHTLVAPRA